MLTVSSLLLEYSLISISGCKFPFTVAVFLQSIDELLVFMQTWGFAISLATFQPGNRSELECVPMPNVMAAQPNIGGALCESSVIPLLVPRHKVWLIPLLECRAITLPLLENARLERKVNWQNSVRSQEPLKVNT